VLFGNIADFTRDFEVINQLIGRCCQPSHCHSQ